jgi:hypothetical protein
MFLRKSDADKCLSEAREASQTAVLPSLFSDAIITIGLGVLRSPVGVGKGFSLSDSEHLRSVLDASFALGLNAVRDSLLKLQVRFQFTFVLARSTLCTIRLTYSACISTITDSCAARTYFFC